MKPFLLFKTITVSLLILLFNSIAFGKSQLHSYGDYQLDLCTENALSPARKTGLHQCLDGTFSFTQPNITNQWNGKCGQTALENVLYAYCKKNLRGVINFDSILEDITPGTHPKTLERGLNQVFNHLNNSCPESGQWQLEYGVSDEDFVSVLKRNLNLKIPDQYKSKRITPDGSEKLTTPVIALIHQGGKSLHWITVVDIYEKDQVCSAVYLELGQQKIVTCSALALSAYETGLYFGDFIKSYTLIRYNKY